MVIYFRGEALTQNISMCFSTENKIVSQKSIVCYINRKTFYLIFVRMDQILQDHLPFFFLSFPNRVHWPILLFFFLFFHPPAWVGPSGMQQASFCRFTWIDRSFPHGRIENNFFVPTLTFSFFNLNHHNKKWRNKYF